MKNDVDIPAGDAIAVALLTTEKVTETQVLVFVGSTLAFPLLSTTHPVFVLSAAHNFASML